MAVKATSNKVKDRLCNNKDKVKNCNKSGIYRLKCQSCNKIYVGQSSRAVKVRWKEHFRDVKNKNLENAVALHYSNNEQHKFNEELCGKILKVVPHEKYLDAWESLYMQKHGEHLMNVRPPPLESRLFKYCM